MKRIFLEDAISENVTITGKNAHHLAYSLRAKKGDKIVAVDKLGMTAVIELVDFDKETIRAKCVSEIEKVNPVEMIKSDSEEKMIKKHITLAECLPKQNKFDTVVEKATELGVDKIVPLISDRTIARPGSLRAQNKLERWGRIAKETAEQSARDTLPEIGAIRELSDWLKEISHTLGYFHNVDKSKKFDGKGELLIFCYENETEVTLQKILQEYKNCDCDKNIILLIGPEGGFTDHEAREIKSYGGVSVSLGKRILKTDTAALSAIAAVQYEFA
ncbi:MAG: 16S rRNA (uracil(1498)-N(3))-methyltransferase [Selenomonadaceae bacterium]|nr:16S rRNA (uracil(1498)-N(3))-methyltransferase [Selenomonadaceae bacterium]